jgi:hypothetical protein
VVGSLTIDSSKRRKTPLRAFSARMPNLCIFHPRRNNSSPRVSSPTKRRMTLGLGFNNQWKFALFLPLGAHPSPAGKHCRPQRDYPTEIHNYTSPRKFAPSKPVATSMVAQARKIGVSPQLGIFVKAKTSRDRFHSPIDSGGKRSIKARKGRAELRQEV